MWDAQSAILGRKVDKATSLSLPRLFKSRGKILPKCQGHLWRNTEGVCLGRMDGNREGKFLFFTHITRPPQRKRKTEGQSTLK